MTITQDPSAPLVAVVGATGIQGGSVINALAQSDKPYRVRGFTRDAAKPVSKSLSARGVDVVAVSFVVENRAEVFKAFVGADFAFLVTNFWEHLNKERETNEGRLLVDAAKAAGVSRIVWSGLPFTSKLTSGRYVNIHHFDSKALVTEYARTAGIPVVDIQAGFYTSNFLNNPIFLTKQEDGSFATAWHIKGETVIPLLDAESDYGLFVREVLERPVFPDGAEILAYSEKISLGDIAKQLARVTGKNIVFRQISIEEFKQGVEAQGLPPYIALDLAESFQYFEEFRWGHDAPPHKGLAKATSTWVDFAGNLPKYRIGAKFLA
ncbi:NAD(P)-binding protein [Mycena polygramma]|nr:NAD(P)-binding protein [Mycena polygramma]